MATKTGKEIELSKQLGHLLKSPDRVKALVLLLERTASPNEISKELGLTLNKASHHVQELRKMKLIELVREEPRRGATEHFYRAVMQPIWNDEDWGKLGKEERQQYVTWLVQLANCDVAEAVMAGTFQVHVDTHASRSALCLDEQGRREIKRIQDEALKACTDVAVASGERLIGQGEEGSHFMVVMLGIDMPPPKRARER